MHPRCRVLIVEDEAAIAMLIEDMVHDYGTEIVGPASTVEQAMGLVRSEHIDAAILDVNVRGRMVFDVADAIRSTGVPVVFATGYSSHVIPDRFRDAPVLEKPFTFDAVREALNRALAGSACDTGPH
jgi:DNA-binding NtrC family response regulator